MGTKITELDEQTNINDSDILYIIRDDESKKIKAENVLKDVVKDSDYVHTDNNYTDDFKDKLTGVEESSNNYTLPSSVVKDNEANTFTAPQRTSITSEDNEIDFSLNNNFTLTATSDDLTAINLTEGQSGVIVVTDSENITGFGSEYTFKNVPDDLDGVEIFAYFIESDSVIRIGRVV